MRAWFVALLLFATSLEGAFLHTIIVADFNDREIGRSSQADALRIMEQSEALALELGLLTRTYFVVDQSYNRDDLLATLSTVDPDANDLVLFYFSGHGNYTEGKKSPWPDLDFGESRIDLFEVAYLLHQLKARFNLVIADCCNDLIELDDVGQVVTRSRNATQTRDRNLTTLFLESEGTLLVTSTSKDEKAYADYYRGGYFTMTLVNVLEVMLPSIDELTWDNLLQTTSEEMNRKHLIIPQTPQWCWYHSAKR